MNVIVKVSGPFFANPSQAVLNSMHDTIEEVVLTGEREAKLMAQPAPSGVFHSRSYAAAHGYFQTGHYNRSIHGTMSGPLRGEISDSNVIYGMWLEKGRGRFKGYAIFRRTVQTLQKKAQAIVAKHISRVVDKLN